jgi:hypothetical protein
MSVSGARKEHHATVLEIGVYRGQTISLFALLARLNQLLSSEAEGRPMGMAEWSQPETRP